MSTKIRITMNLVGIAIVLTGCSETETDSAFFRGSLERTGVYASGGPSQLNELAWKVKTEGVVFSSPVILDGMVYFGSGDGHLYAVDNTTGQMKWKFKTEEVVFSSPAVSDGMVYFGSGDSYLYAVGINTGQEKWRFGMCQ